MRHSASAIAAAILAFSVLACIPTIVSLYRPSAPGGKVASTFCVGDREYVEFERDSVLVRVELSPSHEPPLFASLSFVVPAGRIVLLLDSAVEVSVDTARRGSRIALVPSQVTWPWPPAYGSAGATTIGAPMIGTGTKAGKFARFAFGAVIRPVPNDSFRVTLPEFSVNGDVVGLPSVRFARDRKFIVMPTNC